MTKDEFKMRLQHACDKVIACEPLLTEIDSHFGDGDHGMNMNKGFSLFEKRFADEGLTFTESLDKLGDILFAEIGGSMGPIYGTVLKSMAKAGDGIKSITLKDLSDMLSAGLDGLQKIVQAKVGDKTLVDTLSPAVDSLSDAVSEGADLETALEKMKEAA